MEAVQEKWEYCKLDGINARDYGYSQLVFFTSEGEKIESLSGDEKTPERKKVAIRIAELGKEGWEMVGLGVTSEFIYIVYFKRKRI